MVWAFHSESQEILLSASTAACGGKMTWDDAKALGIYIWMESTESLVCTFYNFQMRSHRSLYSVLTWKSSLVTNTWQEKTVIRLLVHYSTLLWVKHGLFMDYGDKQRGIKSKRLC